MGDHDDQALCVRISPFLISTLPSLSSLFQREINIVAGGYVQQGFFSGCQVSKSIVVVWHTVQVDCLSAASPHTDPVGVERGVVQVQEPVVKFQEAVVQIEEAVVEVVAVEFIANANEVEVEDSNSLEIPGRKGGHICVAVM